MLADAALAQVGLADIPQNVGPFEGLGTFMMGTLFGSDAQGQLRGERDALKLGGIDSQAGIAGQRATVNLVGSKSNPQVQ